MYTYSLKQQRKAKKSLANRTDIRVLVLFCPGSIYKVPKTRFFYFCKTRYNYHERSTALVYAKITTTFQIESTTQKTTNTSSLTHPTHSYPTHIKPPPEYLTPKTFVLRKNITQPKVNHHLNRPLFMQKLVGGAPAAAANLTPSTATECGEATHASLKRASDRTMASTANP